RPAFCCPNGDVRGSTADIFQTPSLNRIYSTDTPALVVRPACLAFRVLHTPLAADALACETRPTTPATSRALGTGALPRGHPADGCTPMPQLDKQRPNQPNDIQPPTRERSGLNTRDRHISVGNSPQPLRPVATARTARGSPGGRTC